MGAWLDPAGEGLVALHLVTGGSGFLGNLIARRLRERGEGVRVLDIWEDPSRPHDIEFVRADVCDRSAVADALRGVAVVHHTAALVPLTKARQAFVAVNVRGSRIVAEEAVKVGAEAFVHMSSSAVFGAPESCPITAQTSPNPIEPYGKAKLAGEQAVQAVCHQSGLPLIVIRPRTILGEGRLGIFQILFEWIREGRNVYVIGGGDTLFQFVHAFDLIDAYMLALQGGAPGTYHVGTDRFGTLRQGLENLVAYAGTRSRVRSLPVSPTITTLRILDRLGVCPLAPWHYLTYHKAFYFDVAPLLRMGWTPRYSNDEMFRESYDWFNTRYASSGCRGAASAHRSPVREGLLWIVRKLS